MLKEINEVLKKFGLSKVRLSKYLGVSRQMLYNYFDYDTFEEWPLDKQKKILELFELDNINELFEKEVTPSFISEVNNRINSEVKESHKEIIGEVKELNKEEQKLIADIVKNYKEIDSKYKHKEKLLELMSLLSKVIYESAPLKYAITYFLKYDNLIDISEYSFDKKEQVIFESIMYNGMTIYDNRDSATSRLSMAKINQTHEKLVKEIKMIKDEKISRTEELNTAKVQALKELGYTTIDRENAKEVLEKIAEIDMRNTKR